MELSPLETSRNPAKATICAKLPTESAPDYPLLFLSASKVAVCLMLKKKPPTPMLIAFLIECDLLHWLAPPQFEIKFKNQTARRGEPAVLQCEAKGEKPIGILWNMNSKRLDSKSDPR